LELTPAGADKFAAMTAEAASFPVGDPRRNIAIVLDGGVITAPAVATDVDPSTGITGGTAIITFGASPDAEQEAKDTAVILRYGSLPVAFEISAVQKVSASLGSDSLQLGIISGLVGLFLVAALLLIIYRSLGALAVIGLSVFGALLLTIFGVLGATQGLTLTLAGVTGVIVSVGITADSYIVYFERIKEEMTQGLTMRAAVDDGYKAAFRTIITADIVSLLAAILLYWLAVGPVKGFALALGIATVLDLIIFRIYTRRAAWLLARTGVGEHGPVSIEALRG
jgi:protein-export membrane protein SecD